MSPKIKSRTEKSPSRSNPTVEHASHLKRNWISLVVVIVVAGVGVIWGLQAKRESTNTPVACTDEAKICPDGTAVGRTGPQCAFADCPSVVKEPTGTKFTNTAIGVSFTLPAGWYVMGSTGAKVDPKSYTTTTFVTIGNGPYGSSISIQANKVTDLNVYPQTVSQWRSQNMSGKQKYSESDVTLGNVKAKKITPLEYAGAHTYLVSRGEWLYSISSPNNESEAKSVLSSLTFTPSEVTATPSNPILTITDIDTDRKFSGYDITSISRMGEKVLIGGNKSFLQVYDRKTKKFTDLSSQLTLEGPQFRTITAITHNGTYWLAVVSGRSENRIIKISGTTVTVDETFTPLDRPARMDTAAYQNGKWLFGSYGGRLFSFDGTTWADISSVTLDRVPPIEAISDIEPDNGAWRIVAENKVYSLNGTTLTAISIQKENEIEELATNGTDWLGVSSGGVLSIQKKGSSIFESLGAGTSSSTQPVWLGSLWLVSETLVQDKVISNPVLSNFYGGFSTPLIAEGGVGYVGHRDGYIYEFTYQLPK